MDKVSEHLINSEGKISNYGEDVQKNLKNNYLDEG